MRAWDFVLRLYAGDGVEQACLALQDDHGQCVPLLLWRAWTLAEDRPVDKEALASAVSLARAWHHEVIEPIRSVRRRLKTPMPPVDDAARHKFRQDVARREMTAERLLIDTLEGLTAHPGQTAAPPIDELRRTVEAWGGAAPDSLIVKLLPS
ncbi:MAG: TIGR02444 family protein [Caulobacteraceae bacterium]|nr:TIGR02444 family protein [Caulobacteraceae bacterium]